MSVQHLLTPEMKAKATAARKRDRVRKKGYAAQGRRGERFDTVHRLRAEAALGKPLPSGAEVHHVDGDKTNHSARLVICQDTAYHSLLHFRARILAAGGNPNTDRICSRCKFVKPIGEFNRNAMRKVDGLDNFCRSCIQQKNKIQKLRRLGYDARANYRPDSTTWTPTVKWSPPTHCKRGHELSGENIRIEIRGSSQIRICRVCDKERCRRKYLLSRGSVSMVTAQSNG